ncbi:MAG: DUF1540 domain-containing protein [Clostridiales bacterium]|jgi:hypothetical protein|nr:DUF1540 domain-containing protein [Clostridiales bacterium]
MLSNQEIKCQVSTCKYNDTNKVCTLHDIQVGNTGSQAHEKQETQCNSFQAN